MTASDALEKILPLFEVYYDILREDIPAPFAAEADFHSHDEQYFLIKSAKYTEEDAYEYIYFAVTDTLTCSDVQHLADTAWAEGLSHVTPSFTHRCSDVGLVILADHADADVFDFVRKLRRSKSYMFTLQGWSNFRLIAIETSSGTMACNRQGQNLKKLFGNINFSE